MDGIDLDATDGHGERGLVDPRHAARCIAERADAAGLSDGLLVARSKSGRGRHVWLIPPAPTVIDDAVTVIAALTAAAYRIAGRDVDENDAQHAFRCGDGTIAEPGAPGAVELYPRSTDRPELGWALMLPMAGAFTKHGGSVTVDPYTDRPVAISAVPRCNAAAWGRLLAESRAALDRVERRRASLEAQSARSRRPIDRRDDRPRRLHLETIAFVNGLTPEGRRNAAACNLYGAGLPQDQIDALILTGAQSCGLPEREARGVIRSAVRKAGAGR